MAVRVLIIDPHAIFRRGLGACLEATPSVEAVSEHAEADEALADPALAGADVVLLDDGLPDLDGLIARLREATPARVLVCTAGSGADHVVPALRAGAVGYLAKQALTPEALLSAVMAAATGSRVLAPDLLERLLAADPDRSAAGRGAYALSTREQRVLRLVADGLPTREVATRMCYSERTVKNVLHDVGTKLNARTRSQAVATALRAGLI
jgi:DNA-binding NarL/FixJ family response regulator